MDFKEIFAKAENGVLTYEQFLELTKDNKFVDLNEGKYVSKKKYEDDIAMKDGEINTLNTTLSSRDTDLADLQQKLTAAGTDAEKLRTLSNDFTTLQTKYDDDVKSYKQQLKKQAYEFAVREYASTKNFSSGAAKRDFIGSMLAKELKMDDGKILGAEDFTRAYQSENADAFVTETPKESKPKFVGSTGGSGNDDPEPTNTGFGFHFIGVRPHDE